MRTFVTENGRPHPKNLAKMTERDRQILRIAVPAIVTNITEPLLGLVDTAIVGHMGSAVYIGAIAVGAMIFNLVYWVFGFLRMGTSGLTAQARGRRDVAETAGLLRRSLVLAMTVAAVMLVLQVPLCRLMMWLIAPTTDVSSLAATYFYIVVWGAPASLGLFALSGWFIGMQNTRLPMLMSIVQNVVNIIASLLLVYVLDMKVDGVATGTVIAQYIGMIVGLALLWRYYRRWFRRSRSACLSKKSQLTNRNVLDRKVDQSALSSMAGFLRINRDIFLRTLCLVAVNLYFTSAGARQGATVLAVNTLLMQLYLIFSYFMDGFAYAGEALGGRYWGARNEAAFRDVVRRIFMWCGAVTLLFTTLYVAGGMPFLRLLTDEVAVVEASQQYVWWAWLIPVAGAAAFAWDGIFIGITLTGGMLLSSFVAAVVFFVSLWLSVPLLGNHGLWLAMMLYLLTRGIMQTLLFCNRVAKPLS